MKKKAMALGNESVYLFFLPLHDQSRAFVKHMGGSISFSLLSLPGETVTGHIIPVPHVL
jgi:hypothetical protein